MLMRLKNAFLWIAFVITGVFALVPVLAREGVEVGKESAFANLVPAAEVEQSARQQYAQMLKEAASKNALGPDDHPQVQRLRRISKELIPFALQWNPRAKDWAWEVNLIGSNQINAFCMPGGKIAFYTGILNQLKLTDDEVAMVMGHEIAHALREQATHRECDRQRRGSCTDRGFGRAAEQQGRSR
jgi:Zn-dependent protease with chaperone function